MKQKLTYSLLVFLFLGSACRNASTEQVIAEEFCQCFQKMTDVYQQVQSEDETEANNTLLDLMKELETAAAASEECVERMEIDYGDLLDKKEEQIKAEMQKRCPKVVETLEAIDQGYE